jgi:inosose dehydratase
MEGVKVACGQITWGKSRPVDEILADIARAGYAGAPSGYQADRTAREIREQFERHGLAPAPGYLGLAFWETEKRGEQLDLAARQAAFARELGLTELYVASNLTPERRAIAGRVNLASATSAADLDLFADLLNEVGRITLAEGVRICFHNHVGSPIETRFEIDELFARVDRSFVFQGADLGHLAWAGGDSVQFCKDYAGSILTLHLKDIDPRVRAEGVAKGWDYAAFSDHGIFAELGEGMIDYPSVFEALSGTGFRGWIVVETDVTQKASPFESARICREYLRSLGV